MGFGHGLGGSRSQVRAWGLGFQDPGLGNGV